MFPLKARRFSTVHYNIGGQLCIYPKLAWNYPIHFNFTKMFLSLTRYLEFKSYGSQFAVCFLVGTFHILVYAYSAVTNLSVEARGPPRNITVGLPLTGLSGATGSKSYYILVITEALKNLVGAGSLAIETFGGIGDPNLYVKHNSKPTQTVYDVHSANSGSTDKVTITSVQTGNLRPCMIKSTKIHINV